MIKLLSYIKKYPLLIFLIALFAPVFIFSPGIAIANLFFLLGVMMFCFVLGSGLRLSAVFSVIVLLVYALLYYFLSGDQNSYILSVLSLISAILLTFFTFKYGYNEKQKADTKHILFVGLALLILFPLASKMVAFSDQRLEKGREVQVVKEIETQISAAATNLEEQDAIIQQDPFIGDLLSTQKYSELLGYSQNYMVSHDVSYMTIINDKQQVVVRAHNSKMIGDDFSLIVPSVKDSSGFGGLYQEGDRFFVARIIDIGKAAPGSKIIIGKFVDQALFHDLENKGVAFAFLDDGLTNVVAKDDLSSIFSALNDRKITDYSKPKLYNYQGQTYLISSHSFSKYLPEIVIVRKHTESYRNMMIILAILVLIALTGSIAYRIRKQRGGIASHKIFRNNQRVPINISNTIIELLLIILATALMFERSNQVYQDIYSEKVFLGAEAKPQVLSPALELGLPSYVKIGEDFNIKVIIDNVSTGTSTIKFQLKYPNDTVNAREIITSGGGCDRAYDKNIDNVQGYINFSCVMKWVDQQDNKPYTVADIKFVAKSAGISSFILDNNYSSITYDKGESNATQQSGEQGDNILVY